jgi:thiol-disulfide isomerase/thioredoxin
MGAGVFTILLVATVFLTLGSTEDPPEEYGNPRFTGAVLPVLEDSEPDPALGTPAPEVTGADFEGNPVAVVADGRAKVILFLAHWCPHCQDEVPIVTGWLESGNLPEDIDLYAVATSIRPTAENYPPSEWLEREEWPAPVLVDDAADTLSRAFGLSAYPFWAFIDDEGNIAGRASGGIPAEMLSEVVANLAAQ